MQYVFNYSNNNSIQIIDVLSRKFSIENPYAKGVSSKYSVKELNVCEESNFFSNENSSFFQELKNLILYFKLGNIALFLEKYDKLMENKAFYDFVSKQALVYLHTISVNNKYAEFLCRAIIKHVTMCEACMREKIKNNYNNYKYVDSLNFKIYFGINKFKSVSASSNVWPTDYKTLKEVAQWKS